MKHIYFLIIYILLLYSCMRNNQQVIEKPIKNILPIEKMNVRPLFDNYIQEIHTKAIISVGEWQPFLDNYLKEAENIEKISKGNIKEFEKEMRRLFKGLIDVRPHYRNIIMNNFKIGESTESLDSVIEKKDTIVLGLKNVLDCIVQIRYGKDKSNLITFTYKNLEHLDFTVNKIAKRLSSFSGYNQSFNHNTTDYIATILYQDQLYNNAYFLSKKYNYKKESLSISIDLIVCPENVTPLDVNSKI